MDKNEFIIEEYPHSRLFTSDIGYLGTRKHHVKALIEVDVTAAKETVRHIKHAKKSRISFFSWLLKCIAAAVSRHPQLHAIKKGKHRLFMFKDIDISIVVEKEVNGKYVPIPLVIRKANEKTVEDIFSEIKNAKSRQIVDERNFVLNTVYSRISMKLFILLPQAVRIFFWRIMLKNPFVMKKTMGTVMVTETGSFGMKNGWVIPVSVHPLCFALSSIAACPDTGKEKMKMTVLIDHDVVDGGKAAAFANELTGMIENCYGLET